MPDHVDYLDRAKDALSEVGDIADRIDKVLEKGEKQADARKGAIRTINEMVDALQLAVDLISKELSSATIEFNSLKWQKEEALRGWFDRVASRFSDKPLRLLLHEGKVCGELHALGDRFGQPFSAVSTGGLSFWDNVRTFFSRSNAMSDALSSLAEGENHFLEEASGFLNAIVLKAEAATGLPWGSIDLLIHHGEELVTLMREKRQVLQDQVKALQDAASTCRGKLH